MKIPKSKPKYANPSHAMNAESTGPSTTIRDMPGKMPKRSPARRGSMAAIRGLNQQTGNFSSDN